MLDDLTSLAFSVHSSKGVYALLLGSGLSTAAGIPTGWDITLDLIRKSAVTVKIAGMIPQPGIKRQLGAMPTIQIFWMCSLKHRPIERTSFRVILIRPRKNWIKG